MRLIKEDTEKAIAAINNGYRQIIAEDMALSPSERTDQKLHIGKASVMRAEIKPAKEMVFEPVKKVQPTMASMVPVGNPYYIQLGAFSDYGRAQSFGLNFSKYGEVEVKPAMITNPAGEGQKEIFRVSIGPFEEQTVAQTKLMAVQKTHQEAMLIQPE